MMTHNGTIHGLCCWAVFTFVLLACARSGDVRHESLHGNPMVGAWALSASAHMNAPGLRLSLAIDSGVANEFHGHITLFFSGDLGIDPSAFAPFRGTVTTDHLVRIPVESSPPGGTKMYLAGRLVGDTIRLTTFTIGRDTVAAEEGHWLLVRQP